MSDVKAVCLNIVSTADGRIYAVSGSSVLEGKAGEGVEGDFMLERLTCQHLALGSTKSR